MIYSKGKNIFLIFVDDVSYNPLEKTKIFRERQ